MGIGALSVSLLMTELILTRLFSVTIWYHFAFLAISVALFGAGAAALLLHFIQRRLPAGRTDELLVYGAVALGLTITLSDAVLLRVSPDWLAGQPFDLVSRVTLQLLILFCAAAAPFFVGGFTISLAMTRYARAIHALYSWDLIGAGLGCLLTIPALSALGAPLALAVVGALAAAAGAPFALGAGRRAGFLRALPIGASFAILLLAALNPVTGLFVVRTAKGIAVDRLKPEYNRWNSFSMVSVGSIPGFRGWGVSPTYNGPLPEQKALVIDMNAFTALTRFDGDFEAARYVNYDCSAFVYRIRPRAPTVCVIGPGGGKDVLAALASGAGHVTAVEINPLIVNGVMRGQFRQFVGGLYDRPDVTVAVEDGRGYVRAVGARSRRPEAGAHIGGGLENPPSVSFDIIQISMVDTSAATAAGAYVLSENSLYTVEAFRDYLTSLTPGGLVSVSWVSLPGLAGGARLCALARAALNGLGIADPAGCVAVIATPWAALPDGVLFNVIVKRGALDAAELSAIAAAAQELAFEVVYLPEQLSATLPPDRAPDDSQSPIADRQLKIEGASARDQVPSTANQAHFAADQSQSEPSQAPPAADQTGQSRIENQKSGIPDREWIGAILAAADDAALRAEMGRWPLDVSPTTDDRPFFFYQNRLRDIGRMLQTARPDHPIGNGLFILAKVILIAVAMTGLFLLAPLVLSRLELWSGAGSPLRDVAYVACLGGGFMFVEIAMIQKFVLYLGRPTYTLAIVLLALLCAGGLGSRLFGAWHGMWLSRRRPSSDPSALQPLTLTLAAVIVFVGAIWQTGGAGRLLDATAGWPDTGRIALAVALLTPLGLLLGMPFPAGLAAVARRAPTRIPWLWGINSATSVLGSVAATLVSIHAGIAATLWTGAALYALALLLAPGLRAAGAPLAAR